MIELFYLFKFNNCDDFRPKPIAIPISSNSPMGQMGPPSSGATSGVFDQSGQQQQHQQPAQVNLFNSSQSTRKSLKNLRKTIN